VVEKHLESFGLFDDTKSCCGLRLGGVLFPAMDLNYGGFIGPLLTIGFGSKRTLAREEDEMADVKLLCVANGSAEKLMKRAVKLERDVRKLVEEHTETFLRKPK
jgi:hypothetical protein